MGPTDAGPTVHTVNIREAKKHLSRLVAQAAGGEPFVIAKAGIPLVKVIALGSPVAGQIRRLGFLSGGFSVPPDFDRMGTDAIERSFEGKS